METLRTVVRPLTVGPILKGKENDNSIGVWVRGKGKPGYFTFGVVKLDNRRVEILELIKCNDYINMFNYNDIEIGMHAYQVGYIYSKIFDLSELFEKQPLDWTSTENYKFEIHRDKPLSFVFGSCRKLIRFGGVNLCGTGTEGDRIFRAIHDQSNLDFVLNIGDKVYFDPTNNIKQYKTLEQKRGLYGRVYNFPEQKSLYTEIQGYDICDDHDLAQNNAGQATREDKPLIFLDGMKAYREYQHISGPVDSIGEPLHYIFERKGFHFFVMDTRSQRNELLNPSYMLSSKQLDNFTEWLRDPLKRDSYKFVVSSVPLLSQPKADSWYGFPVQQRKILELLCGEDLEGTKLKKIVVLTGDAHCARVGVYSVFDSLNSVGNIEGYDKLLGTVPEILSSGLVAINHDKGKMLTRFTILDYYNDNNDFPYLIDQTERGGLKIITSFSSCSYPDPAKPVGLRKKLSAPFKQVVDNVFVKITETPDLLNTCKNRLEIQIINQDNIILNKLLL